MLKEIFMPVSKKKKGTAIFLALLVSMAILTVFRMFHSWIGHWIPVWLASGCAIGVSAIFIVWARVSADSYAVPIGMVLGVLLQSIATSNPEVPKNVKHFFVACFIYMLVFRVISRLKKLINE